MAQFLEGTELNLAIEKLFKGAKKEIIIISPFVKIHPKIKDSLMTQLDNKFMQLTVLFGKNEENLSKSISLEDLEFFKQFADVEIRHEPRLHAKYYANEESAILSSMNLYDFSQNYNIEFGILTTQKNEVSGKLDEDAHTYFMEAIEKSKLLYRKVAEFESKMFGLKDVYKESIVDVDIIEEQFKSITKNPKNNSKLKNGYCIRTGAEIPFDTDMPMSDKAYASWSKYKDGNYAEKYCHFSGEESKGETSFSRPVLKKNWKKAVSK